MKTNIALNGAKRKKNDEFYTLYEDIEEAVELYKDHFKGKKVLCNCNNSKTSNFYKYFINNFKELRLKQLTCTTYSRGGTELNFRPDLIRMGSFV